MVGTDDEALTTGDSDSEDFSSLMNLGRLSAVRLVNFSNKV